MSLQFRALLCAFSNPLLERVPLYPELCQAVSKDSESIITLAYLGLGIGRRAALQGV